MTKKLFIYILFAAALAIPNAATAITNCDDQAKPAFSCPPGYSVVCSSSGGYHWACGKESRGAIEETTSLPATELQEGTPSSIYPSVETNTDIKIQAVTPSTKAGSETTRETDPAVSTLQACQAKCRDTYGGSGSSGFDACMRACGAGGAARGAACPGNIAPACEVPQILECRDGKWICVPPATGGSGGARTAPSVTNEGRDRLRIPPAIPVEENAELNKIKPRMSTSIQVKKVEVRGWDPKKKEEFLESIKEHAEAKSGQDLENFARGVLLKDENVEEIAIGEERVQFSYKMPAKFLGVFNSSLTARIDVDSESKAKVRYPWFRFLYKKQVSATEIHESVEKATQGLKQTMQTQVKLNTIGEDAQLTQVDLQNKLQKQQQVLQTISNVSKMLHDTAMSVIRKIN